MRHLAVPEGPFDTSLLSHHHRPTHLPPGPAPGGTKREK
jgi:hypothetical protein